MEVSSMDCMLTAAMLLEVPGGWKFRIMEKYFKRKFECSSGEQINSETRVQKKQDGQEEIESNVGSQRDVWDKIDLAELPSDPGLRSPIANYNVNVQDEIRRAYIQKGPCQPRNHLCPQKEFGDPSLRRFKTSWFNDFPDWLEYSISKDAIFCFYCYLFKPNSEEHGGGDSFIDGGFSNWKKKERLQIHVGKSSNAHNRARIKYEAFVNQKQNIDCVLFKKSKKTKDEYRIRLNASIDCVRLLLRQGLSFRGHDESENSRNQGNFLEFLQWLCDHNKETKDVCLSNALENLQLTSPKIQKDIASGIAFETFDVIMRDIGDRLFSILVDESVGANVRCSTLCESERTSNRIISSLRGQGYDGASNMRGEHNGLKALILKENPSAFYIHCFAHQLQLALVAVASKHAKIETFFSLVNNVVNVVGGSAKQLERGLNQEITLKRPGDTRWGSHYNSLLNLIIMFSATVDVVEMIATDDTSYGKRGKARILLGSMLTFDFVFSLHLMKKVLGISDELSKSLQRRDQDIVNAIKLVKISKERFQAMGTMNGNHF
ncbi:zinc finger MYM-type protein 1-like [Olea europaea var. sylvestris]|uniref:zinc finger MYM-type protein 1-like n=1 Tax=Olea europaea var. sylvestris TaxID=158386 RepID=UPI000C1D32A5|nr:zinc finger MYM-type protein 1-like [Olea europaea var. sylvestris]